MLSSRVLHPSPLVHARSAAALSQFAPLGDSSLCFPWRPSTKFEGLLAGRIRREFRCRPSFAELPKHTKLLVIVALRVITHAGGLGKCVPTSSAHFLYHNCAQRLKPLGAMTAAFQHLKVTQLSSKEKEAVLDCGKFLSIAPFKAQDDYKVCTDNTGLRTSSQVFIDIFALGIKVPYPQISRMTSKHRLIFHLKQVRWQGLQTPGYAISLACKPPRTRCRQFW